MAPHRFKLILLSHDLSKKIELTLTHRKVKAALWGLVVFVLATNVVAGLLASSHINSRENKALQEENRKLREHLSQVETRLAGVDQQVSVLSETDRRLRMMADLPLIDASVREVGVGGSVKEPPIDPKLPELTYTQWSLEQVEREIELQKASFEEIHQKLTADAQLLDHTPTMRPLQGGYVSSGFGYRTDPFTKRVEAHAGVDICQERGTSVVTAAAGQVIYAGHYYSYGKFVVIDHGYGYQTAYGHLNGFNVRQGQYLTKGETIGTVGSTGRATAPHLHYEVRLNGRTVDPTDYFFEDVALPALARR